MQKKVGIITYHRSENYGSALQAYALQSYLAENGFDVRIIDYHYKGQDELYAIFKPIKSVKSLCRFIFTLINYRSLNEKKIKYRQFQKKYFLLTAEYTEVTQLYELNNQFEYFIAGSDQIWNICCPDFTDAYLLSFVRNKKKCISYAPSINKFGLDSKAEELFENYLPSFKAISCREKNGVELLSSLLNKPVDFVPDPVFLVGINFWMNMISHIPSRKEKYLFCYFLSDKSSYREIANKIAKQYSLKIVLVKWGMRDIFCHNPIRLYSSNPEEFLRLLYDAEIVLADSFHALAFSIIFKKKILNLNCSDSRRLSALKTIYPTVEFDTNQIIDFAELSDVCQLDKYVQNGKNFLVENLKD